MPPPKIYRWLLVDCLLLATLLFAARKCQQFGRATARRGFFCDDATLRYPYRDSTVSTDMLYLIAFYFPLSVIIIVELQQLLRLRWQRRGNPEAAKSEATQEREATLLLESYKAASVFLLGYSCERFFVAVAKYTVGRLRPHFVAVCLPQLADGSSCDDLPLPHGRYIEHFSCLGVNATAAMLGNLRQSFPSGHSSLSFYGMVLLAFYLQRRMCGRSFAVGVLKPLLQLGCLLVAWYVALSRVMDYQHHWSDVLAGAAVGATVAVFVAVSTEGGWRCKQQVLQRQMVACSCAEILAANHGLIEVKGLKSIKSEDENSIKSEDGN